MADLVDDSVGQKTQQVERGEYVPKHQLFRCRVQKWWSEWGSNPRPSHCERDALPIELPPPFALTARIYICMSRVVQGFCQ